MRASAVTAALVPILNYHNIARVPRGLRRWRSLYVPPRAFARQMHLLQMLGYAGIAMSEAMPYLRGERTGKVIAITLDDGYADNVDAALPILLRCGFRATCYVVSGSIGRYNDWDAEKLGVRKPLMSASQMREWHAAGMEIGAHTRTHPHLTQCTGSELRDEVTGSRSALEDTLGSAVTQFCYPYGDVDARVASTVHAAGFAAATTTARGRARAFMDPLRLPRIQIVRHHMLPQFAWRVLTGYEDRRA